MFVFVSRIVLPIRCSHKNWYACRIPPYVLHIFPISLLLITLLMKSINYESANYVLSTSSGCFQIFFFVSLLLSSLDQWMFSPDGEKIKVTYKWRMFIINLARNRQEFCKCMNSVSTFHIKLGCCHSWEKEPYEHRLDNVGHTVVCSSFQLQIIFLIMRDSSCCTLLHKTVWSRTVAVVHYCTRLRGLEQ